MNTMELKQLKTIIKTLYPDTRLYIEYRGKQHLIDCKKIMRSAGSDCLTLSIK